MANILELRDLCVSYGAIDALKSVNISVEEGSIVALLGANGAGKRLLSEQYPELSKPKADRFCSTTSLSPTECLTKSQVSA